MSDILCLLSDKVCLRRAPSHYKLSVRHTALLIAISCFYREKLAVCLDIWLRRDPSTFVTIMLVVYANFMQKHIPFDFPRAF